MASGVLGSIFLTSFAIATLFDIVALGEGNNCPEPLKDATRLIVLGDSFFYGGAEFNKLCLPIKGEKFSDGRIIPDYIAEYLFQQDADQDAKVVVAYKGTDDVLKSISLSFAMAGAGVKVSKPNVPNIELKTLESQVDFLVQKKGELNLHDSDNVLYLISIGTEDYLDGVKGIASNPGEDVTAKVKNAVADVKKGIRKAVDTIRGLPGGKIFAFMNVGDLSLWPAVQRAYGKQENNKLKFLKQVADEHYTQLDDMLREEHVQYSILKYHNLLSDWIKRPDTCGHYDANKVQLACCNEISCCEVPSLYVFWDARHYTEHVNYVLASLFWSGETSVVSPQNLKKLAGTKTTVYHFNSIDI